MRNFLHLYKRILKIQHLVYGSRERPKQGRGGVGGPTAGFG